MATPLTADQIVGALRKWGLTYHEQAGWRTRTTAWGPFGPVHGFVVHHTGDDAPDDADLNVVLNGRAGLSGPLAHFGGRDDGSIDLIGCHRANHAGGGDPAVLAAVIAESYGDYPPPTHFHEGQAGQADGNTCFYGLETYYSGGHTPVQYGSMVRLVAAILDAHSWSAKSAIGHKEWSDWKVDPGNVDMKAFRADVQWCLDNGPAKATARFSAGAPAPATATDTGGALDMALTEDQLYQLMRKAARDSFTGDNTIAMKRDGSGKVTESWTAAHVDDWQSRMLSGLAAMLKTVDEKLSEVLSGQAAISAAVQAVGEKAGVSADDLKALSDAAAKSVKDALDAKITGVGITATIAPTQEVAQ